jgi:hypothetical protein
MPQSRFEPIIDPVRTDLLRPPISTMVTVPYDVKRGSTCDRGASGGGTNGVGILRFPERQWMPKLSPSPGS